MIPLFLVVALTGGQSVAETLAALVAGVGLALLWTAGVAYSIRRTRFGVKDRQLVFRAPLRHHRLANVPGVVQVVRIPRADGTGRFWQVWAGEVDAVVLNEEAWRDGDLASVARAVGAALSDEATPLTMRELGYLYPQATPWLARHMRAVFAAMLAAVGLLILFAVLSSGG